MGFEWSRKKNEESEKIDTSKRRTFQGLAALGAASMLPFNEAQASDLPELKQLKTPEEREINAERIFLYAAWIKHMETAFAQATSSSEIEALAYAHLPALEESVIQGTQLDYKEFMRKGGWPSTLLRWTSIETNPKTGTRKEQPYAANSFSVNNLVVTNKHVLGNFPDYIGSTLGLDLAACSFENEQVVPSQEIREHREETQLSWNPDTVYENLHGNIVYIPANRISSEGNVVQELVPAVLIRITPNFLYSARNPDSYFGEKASKKFGQDLVNSYMAVVAPHNIDTSENRNGDDVKGMSGSPVISWESCQQGKKNVCGDVWGVYGVSDEKAKQSRSVALIHGPEVLGSLLDQLGHNYASAEAFERAALVSKIQEALNIWRHSKGMDLLAVDGDYGRQTASAVYLLQMREFGKDASQYTKGAVDEKTWRVLFKDEPYIDVFSLPE